LSKQLRSPDERRDIRDHSNTATVIASEAKQSIATSCAEDGLLRFARNDVGEPRRTGSSGQDGQNLGGLFEIRIWLEAA
jgi:hypothetical protein